MHSGFEEAGPIDPEAYKQLAFNRPTIITVGPGRSMGKSFALEMAQRAGVSIVAMPDTRRQIESATEIYPGECEEFLRGVTAVLNYESPDLFFEYNHFKRGFWRAAHDEVIKFYKL